MKIKDKNLYYVGGVVRDEILGTESFDTDFCYEGDAIKFAQGLNIIRENPEFGTVRVLSDSGEIDIASTRIEVYPKAGHLPVVDKIGCALKEDLRRRDFTINALAKNTVTGEIIDYFDGLEDIKSKKLRVLHDKSFIDDPTRIIRGLKFSIRFGFELDENTKKLQANYLKNINYDISYHRLKKELIETFSLNTDRALEKFISADMYKLLGKNQIVPKLACSVQTLVNKYKPFCTWIVYIGFFDLSLLDLNSEEQAVVDAYSQLKGMAPENDFEVYKLFKDLPIEAILLYALTENYSIAIDYLERISKVKICLSGKDLLALKIPQGKIYQEIFDYVVFRKLQEPKSSLENELSWVKEKFLC